MRSIFSRLHRRYGKKITGAQRQQFVADKISEQPVAEISPQAKQAATRERRLAALMADSRAGVEVKPMRAARGAS